MPVGYGWANDVPKPSSGWSEGTDGTIASERELGVGYMICDGGEYELVQRGIAQGCPLSPLMGAVCLSELDRAMERLGLFYARFMDGWVILAPSRRKLRQAIRLVTQELARLKVRQHPDKTFIGRVERGFDFLGYRFTPSGLGIARPTAERFVGRARRLYEQGADWLRIDEYVRRWRKWVRAGIEWTSPDQAWEAGGWNK